MRLLKYSALAVAAAAPAVWVLWPPGAAPLPAASAQSATAAIAAAPPPFAPSMAGTRPDGDLRQDASDHLVINEELLHLFDYYLSALGEQDLPAIRAGIERDLRTRLSATAAAKAVALLDRYISYKRALVAVERAMPAARDAAGAARARLEAMQRLRRDYFSLSEFAGLFGAADARDRETLARLEIAQDRQLSEAERRAKLAAAESRLSAVERAERDAPTRVLTLETAVAESRSRGADDNEVYRQRAAALSPEAAARLAEVDREETDWRRRIAAYSADRARLGGDPAALQQLRDARFTPQEQKRLTAYE
ncbi:lipase secretion chaperone [Pseudoduganella sp. UC29_106]|uniref:lipase secretion chaperone n=1 Tax=Pseudoduganella sp. UC29_106 TaxID=3374553 RepID=UPI003757F6B3